VIRPWTAISFAAALCGALPAQERPVAIQNARVLTISDKTLENATVIMRGGVIETVGEDVEVPAGAAVIDAKGGTLMPGLVSAYSRAGLSSGGSSSPSRSARGRRWRPSSSRGGSSAPAANKAATKVLTTVYARQDIFGELLECGVTTLALTPSGAGFPGQGGIVDPAGRTLESLTIDDEAFVLISATTGTKSKKLIKDTLEKAAKALEERKKPKAPAEPKEQPKPEAKQEAAPAKGKPNAKEKPAEPEKKAEKKPAEPEKKPEPKKPAPRKDPNVEVLADVLDGKRRAYLLVSSASALAHFKGALGEKTEFPARAVIAPTHSSTQGRLDEVLDQLEPFKGTILTTPALTSPAYSHALINPPAMFDRAGYDVGFILGDTQSDIRGLFFRLIDLVRFGLDRDAALAAVTHVPAKALGIEDRVGAIAEGKDADVLLFDRDPLDPAANLLRIWHKGREIAEETTR